MGTIYGAENSKAGCGVSTTAENNKLYLDVKDANSDTLIAGEDNDLDLLYTKNKVTSADAQKTEQYSEAMSVATEVVKDARGSVLNFLLSSASASKAYLVFFNRATVPTSGSTAISTANGDKCYAIPAGTTIGLGAGDFAFKELVFDTGITVALSSDPDTYTAVATPSEFDLSFDYL